MKSRWDVPSYSYKQCMRHQLLCNPELTVSLALTSPKKNHNGFLDSNFYQTTYGVAEKPLGYVILFVQAMHASSTYS